MIGLLKALVGISLIKGVSVSRGVGKSKQRAKLIKKDIFVISQFVVELTTFIATLMVGTFKLTMRVFKFIHSGFCKNNTVIEKQVSKSNVVDFVEYKNKKIG